MVQIIWYIYMYHDDLDMGAVLPISLYKNLSRNQLWEFIIGHMMKTIRPILHPTALRQKRFVTLAILCIDKHWCKMRTSAIAYIHKWFAAFFNTNIPTFRVTRDKHSTRSLPL